MNRAGQPSCTLPVCQVRRGTTGRAPVLSLLAVQEIDGRAKISLTRNIRQADARLVIGARPVAVTRRIRGMCALIPFAACGRIARQVAKRRAVRSKPPRIAGLCHGRTSGQHRNHGYTSKFHEFSFPSQPRVGANSRERLADCGAQSTGSSDLNTLFPLPKQTRAARRRQTIRSLPHHFRQPIAPEMHHAERKTTP